MDIALLSFLLKAAVKLFSIFIFGNNQGSDMEKLHSRRSVLCGAIKCTIGFTAASVLGSTLLTSCKKGSNKTEPATGDLLKKGEAGSKQLDPSICHGTDSLTEQQKAVRSSLKYVDQTPIKSQLCENCKLYTTPLPTATCGGCKVVPGPIHPKGYCIAWVARM